MPIGNFERGVLLCIAANRNPESYVSGATVLNQRPGSPRTSEDINVFHDTVESLRVAFEADVKTLTAAGYEADVVLRHDTFVRAVVQRGGSKTKVEWANDSPFRFFPVEQDAELGWRLNFWDAATNKLQAFTGRSMPRDYVDVIHIHRHSLRFAALVWAAAGKDPGLTPEMLVGFARRNSKYRPEDFASVILHEPLDLVAMKQTLLAAAEEAEALFAKLPPEDVGCFYLDAAGRPVCPDPASPEFPNLTRHFGSVRGAVPRIAED